MRSGSVLAAAAVLAVVAAGTATADAASSIRPRPGSWSGREANGTAPAPVSFTVGPAGGAVTNFSGEAIVKTGCTNHIQGFSAPTGPMPITAGRFHGVETSYPQRGVRVVVVGTFISRSRARGHIKIRFKRVEGCDAVRGFTAHRVRS